MNASWMLGLYPRNWRARYEPEFRAMLDDRELEPSDILDILLGALDAHLRPQLGQPEGAPEVTLRSPRRQDPRLQAFFFAHAAFFLMVNVLLIGLNVLFSSGTWWFPYVLWGTGMVLVAHAGLMFPWRGYFGLHLGLYTVLNIGLVAINITQGGSSWSAWPVVTLGMLLVTHGLLAFGKVSLFQAHVIASTLASIELVVLPMIVDTDAPALVLTAAMLWVFVLAHWLIRYRGVSLFTAHLATYIGVIALQGAINALDTSTGWWVRFPVISWGVFVVAHGLLDARHARSGDTTWEASTLRRLRARSGESAAQRRLRGFLFHAAVFTLGAIGFLLLDVTDGSGEWWAWWPIGAWLALLFAHAGWVLIPARLFGPHLFAWIAASVGLYLIDRGASGGAWWAWPVMWWGVAVAAHAGTFLPVRSTFLGMHLLGGVALSAAFIGTDLLTGPTTWWWFPVAAVIFTMVMHAGFMLERSMLARR